ncbi:hypothetical protein HY642_05465 [Candidatus Woesearchaeota archaeon]|nr:hypothetical protein [Candidatus Woesearchaeota archaeon]
MKKSASNITQGIITANHVITTVLIIITLSLAVFGYRSNRAPSIAGHSADEIEMPNGQSLAQWTGTQSAGIGTCRIVTATNAKVVTCPAGTAAIGGGVICKNFGYNAYAVEVSCPASNNVCLASAQGPPITANQWMGECSSGSVTRAGAIPTTVYATCCPG